MTSPAYPILVVRLVYLRESCCLTTIQSQISYRAGEEGGEWNVGNIIMITYTLTYINIKTTRVEDNDNNLTRIAVEDTRIAMLI